METTHSILVSVDDDTHRRARIRAEQLQLSVPELAASVLANAVQAVDASEDSRGQFLAGGTQRINEIIHRIRAAHPDFRASDNLSRDRLYDRNDDERS